MLFRSNYEQIADSIMLAESIMRYDQQKSAKIAARLFSNVKKRDISDQLSRLYHLLH